MIAATRTSVCYSSFAHDHPEVFMTSRVLRTMLLMIFVAGAGAAAYFIWTGESEARASRDVARVFDQQTRMLMRGVLELRAAQEGYVAVGQGDQFWATKVTGLIASLRETLAAARKTASVPAAQGRIDEASSLLNDFEQMDNRAREYARSGQRLLASDLVFSDGVERTDAAIAAIDEAQIAQSQATAIVTDGLRLKQVVAGGAAALLGLLIVLVLLPVPEAAAPEAPASLLGGPTKVPTKIDADDTWTPAVKAVKSELAAEERIEPLAPEPVLAAPAPAPAPAAEPVPLAAAVPSMDLKSIAAICNDLARVSDTLALSGLLERTGTALDASGLIIWIADPDGRELNPIVAHGYPAQLVTRLGTIPRDAENATAAAYRTGLLQTVDADAVSNGAIAAPLVTPVGCVGVMAAEVRNGGEKEGGKLAAASIVAAQLATLVGPPSARAHTKVEAAGA
jgi:hypothetical protein